MEMVMENIQLKKSSVGLISGNFLGLLIIYFSMGRLV